MMKLEPHFKQLILDSTGADSVQRAETLQNLWSGYGQIVRYTLHGARVPSVVVKHVRLPQPSSHPRGWNTDISHQRKLKSYQVETAWYQQYSSRCKDLCRVPQCLAVEKVGEEVFMVLEDLDAAGYPLRKSSVTIREMKQCLKWLAHFHATFLHTEPVNLWETGTYWHLATRPDEWEALEDTELKKAAKKLDAVLNAAKYQTLVHGDAKLANFCFSPSGNAVSAVDFQYVGGGCGMKDVAYFIGSCLYEEDCERYETELLDAYFDALKHAVGNQHSEMDKEALETEWRQLFPVAWTDFHRFIKGWSPGHWKINSYSERVARETIARLL